MKSSKAILKEYFKAGEKSSKKIGVEFEHFLISKADIKSFGYYDQRGQKSIMKQLVNIGWQVQYAEGDDIFNAVKAGNMISFEPGGQVEISIKPFESVKDIKKEYLAVKSEIEGLLDENQALISLGYHPFSKIDDLPLLPKKRYEFMFEALHKRGRRARNMMKGTASTQVSIDFESEIDFIKKFRVANFLSPFISRLFDAAPVFEGKVYNEENLRVQIWDETDISRCKIPIGAMDGKFDYDAYCDYILNSEPILMIEDGGSYMTGHQTVLELDQKKPLSEAQLIHATTMVFPDIRVKQFLEIRIADAIPLPYSLALPALVKGIFYCDKVLNKYYDMSLKISDQDMIELNAAVKRSLTFDVECLPDHLTCSAFINNLIVDAREALEDEDEKEIINVFYKMILEEGSYARYMKRLIKEDKQKFVDALVIGGNDV